MTGPTIDSSIASVKTIVMDFLVMSKLFIFFLSISYYWLAGRDDNPASLETFAS
jgi:hypothetical protein